MATSSRKKSSSAGKLIDVPTNKIISFNKQPRDYFNGEAQASLTASIKAVKQQTPAKVKPLKNGRYQLVDGERRWRACKTLGIPLRVEVVIVRNTSEQKLFSGVANFGREGHTPIEVARYIDWMLNDRVIEKMIKQDLLDSNGGILPQGKRRRKSPNKPTVTEKIEWISRVLAHSNVWVYDHIKLLRLPSDVQDKIRKSKGDKTGLSSSFAIELAGAVPENQKLQRVIAKKVVSGGLKTKQARDLMYNEIARAGEKPGKQSGPGQRQTLSYNAKRLKGLINRLDTGSDRLFDLSDKKIEEALAEFDTAERDLLETKLSEGVRKLRVLQLKLANLRNISNRKSKTGKSAVAA